MTTAPATDVFTARSTLTFVESMRLGLRVGIFLADDADLDRTSINAWEDVEFRRAPVGWVSLVGGLPRDWAGTTTALDVVGVVRGSSRARADSPSPQQVAR